ncbi:MAG: ROK family protein, partial [Pseudomonadota bacterium]|nr:ROK family protein [Pseudomonadota bacterium]
INLMDPHVIVLGGGVSNINSVYDVVPQLWQEWVFSDSVVTPLKKSVHGDSSGVRGAAWLGAQAVHSSKG